MNNVFKVMSFIAHQNSSNATINLQRSIGGPCLGCSYITPQTSDIGKQLVLTFDRQESTATATIDGVATRIQRFNFNLGTRAQRLLGAWTIVSLPVPDDSSGNIDTGAEMSNYIVCSTINKTIGGGK
ncbi:hypothetical protein TAO_0979 [Candidatus Nitrosoglobus terrae]|uniref:Uncharacterized protein n=1 Tax=Candidatus Nitrosoglobus terrae TaxID=1630141 RepID=A0A1Q2SMM6_9GAMM|nr:hypothetical protein [Candidatus Nitrosoglobus terrae]BAW80349.1 hypothetical protein TAO_0979 [Candidatus Nitrosoglobus terrae]